MTNKEEGMREHLSSLEKEKRELQERLDHATLVESRELQKRIDHVTLAVKEKRTLLSLIELSQQIIDKCEREIIPPQTA